MKRTRRWSARSAFAAFLAVMCTVGYAQTGSLEEQFRNPPDSAKPRAWWHWMSGNVTEPGITADLEWMHRVGIAGMQMFDGDMGAPLFVDKPVIWMSPEWKSAWRHAAAEADRLHMEMSMAASGGWSETAGPWVKPEQGMKKYVWSETIVEGPGRFNGTLRKPPATVGKFQDLPPAPPREMHPDLTLPGAQPQPPIPKQPPTPELYEDAAVVAFPAPAEEMTANRQKPEITCSCGVIDGAALIDGSFAKTVQVPYSPDDHAAWIQFAYAEPQPVQAIVFGAGPAVQFSGPAIPSGKIEASDDGATWRTLVELPGGRGAGSVNFAVRTFSIEPVKARYFRLYFVAPQPDPLRPPPAGVAWPPPVRLTEVEFLTSPRVQRWEDKASFGIHTPTSESQGAEVQPGEAIDPDQIIDLTGKMRPDGTLDWDAPAGKWIVLRLGYSLTGEVNHPATPAATGLEVDKLSSKDVQAYVEEYVKMISAAAGPYFGKSFRYFLMDSWEAGQENWTDDMMAAFMRRRGYAMAKFLPVLTGRIVGSRAQSEAFLWDFRRTQADLLAENHYAIATKYFAKFGVGLYAEAMGTGMPTTGDGLLNKGQVTVPMGEFWTPLPNQKDTPSHIADVMEAGSAAHIYGKPIAATESFTTRPNVMPWGQSPFYLKSMADQDFARGINRIVFHTSDLQPFVDDAHKPGMTLGPFGQDYTRNITWAEQALAWNTYLARCSFLLQQGKPVNDVAYFYGEDAPATVPFWKKFDPALPTHFGFDFLDADVLLHGATATPGHLRLASGITYRLLVLPNDLRLISLPLLRSIHNLVEQGAVLLGPRPVGSPSLADGPDAPAEVARLAADLWGDDAANGHVFGRGKVYTGKSIEDALAAENAAQDFSWSPPENVSEDIPYSLPGADSDEDLLFIHRHDADREIYFVSTQKHHGFDVKTTFRVTGKAPRLWHPESGETELASYTTEHGQTLVPMHFDAQGSVFVVFDGAGAPVSRTVPEAARKRLTSIDGPWKLAFPPNLGAPAETDVPALESWTQITDPGIKYFSGTATYRKQLDAPQGWFQSGAKVMLDLGAVKEMAEVEINGKPIGGILWRPPFEVDVTQALKPGSNEIRVKVTNLWPNRMIGDLQPGAVKTYTWTDFRPFKADSPLLESGLLGPVTLWRSERPNH
jgi:alpha-L-rhamnosidase/Glycosyl hydrolases family 2, sugar binding domain/F5/8 type C domain